MLKFNRLGVFFFLAYLMTGCGGSSDGSSPPVTPSPPAVGNLTFTSCGAPGSSCAEEQRKYYGDVYFGTYKAPDGVSIEVWISNREGDTRPAVGTVERMGVAIQGGTGAPVDNMLDADRGLHALWVAINYRGSSMDNITSGWECLPGTGFVSCLERHGTFSKINPKLNAQDANSVISLLADDNAEITVDGRAMKVSEFVPSGTVSSHINLYTSSFGGVIVSYMLAEDNRPELHNVFFEQVTAPGERVISDGLNNAARMMDILFSACEDDASCIGAYPDIRVNFRRFMDAHHSVAIELDGVDIYAGGVFDRIAHIVEEGSVGKAVRYIGEIANAYNGGSTTITTGHEPQNYESVSGEQPRATYGLPQLDGDDAEWNNLLRNQDFFPGITNRTGMICSFSVNRVTSPDSLSRFDMVKSEALPGDPGGTKETFGYGFLVSYRTFLSVCPRLIGQTGRLELPNVSGIDAENVIVFRGGLDIKHQFNQAQDEIMGYFTSSANHRRVITQKFLAQAAGQDEECMSTVRNNFWNADDTTDQSLGDDCEESNSLTASGLEGW